MLHLEAKVRLFRARAGSDLGLAVRALLLLLVLGPLDSSFYLTLYPFLNYKVWFRSIGNVF